MAQQPAPAGPRRAVQAMGESALLVDCPDLADVLGLHALLRAEPLPEQAELVPAASTLLVRFRTALTPSATRQRTQFLRTAAGFGPDASPAAEARIPVVYDGEDLAGLARHLGCSEQEVVARHTRACWTAAFGGFSPGFSYLVQQDPAPENVLEVPRRDSPRTRVPAGSVALAGAFSAVYPSASPGGWQLVGRTEAPVWDLHRDPPALLGPGTRVRFEAVREQVRGTLGGSTLGGSAPEPAPASPTTSGSAEAPEQAVAAAAPRALALQVESPGLSALVQDAGRAGHADWGVSPSGWADPLAAREANRLVGNPASAAVLESTGGGLRLRAQGDLVLALTGARTTVEVHTSAGRLPVPSDRPFAVASGQRILLGPATQGLRAYLAVRGGIRVPEVLGSAATDTLSALGPEPLARGTRLEVGPSPRQAVAQAAAPCELPEAPGAERPLLLRLLPGPRADWFTPSSLRDLARTTWRVDAQSNRVGVRLDLPEEGTAADPAGPLRRTPQAQGRELPSEGLVPGAVQVPPSGRPIVFLTDHPVTGGYPVVGVLPRQHLRLLAQAPPGTAVRLVWEPPPSPAPV